MSDAQIGEEFTNPEELEIETGEVTPEQVSQAVLYGSDWTTETIISQIIKENIDINPRFQRRDAWDTEKKSKFIESIILGLPIPPIVMAERKGEKGKFIVLDGKQRLLSLLQFTGNAPQSTKNAFPLIKLEIRPDLNKKSFVQLSAEPQHKTDLNAFFNQTIRTVVIRNWPSEAFLNTVFLRLNTTSSPLAPQELRQALIPGPFMDYIDDKAFNSNVVMALLGLEEPDFRMRDVELLIRFLAFKNFITDYTGNLRLFLDQTCQRLNRGWDENRAGVDEDISAFEESITAGDEIFLLKNFGKVWLGDRYQSRLNRAVIDIMVFYFSSDIIREQAVNRRAQVESAFKSLCLENAEFKASLEATTKSIPAVHARFSIWGHALRQILQIDFPVVGLDAASNRLTFE